MPLKHQLYCRASRLKCFTAEPVLFNIVSPFAFVIGVPHFRNPVLSLRKINH